MIRLERPDEPPILKRKRAGWSEKFTQRSATRPNPRQYGHEEVRQSLRMMSDHKCCYCEAKLPTTEEETVDHFVEVSEDPSLAFSWDNLYLCCRGCQNKLKKNIPLGETLDPCGSHDPADHLFFEDEHIRALDESSKGQATIRRFQLQRLDLRYKRIEQLKSFLKVLNALTRQHGPHLSRAAAEPLRAFAQADHAYSFMFRQALKDFYV